MADSIMESREPILPPPPPPGLALRAALSVLWVRASGVARRAVRGVTRGVRRGAELVGLRSTPPAPDAPLAMMRDGRIESLLAQVAADQAAEREGEPPPEHVTRSTARPIARSDRPTAVEIKRAG